MPDAAAPLLALALAAGFVVYVYLRPTTSVAQHVSRFLSDVLPPRPPIREPSPTVRVWEYPAGRKLLKYADLVSLAGRSILTGLFVWAIIRMPVYSMSIDQFDHLRAAGVLEASELVTSTSLIMMVCGGAVSAVSLAMSQRLRRRAGWYAPQGAPTDVSDRWFWSTQAAYCVLAAAVPVTLLAGNFAPRLLLVYMFLILLIPSCVQIAWKLAFRSRRAAAASLLDLAVFGSCAAVSHTLLLNSSTVRLPSDTLGWILPLTAMLTAFTLLLLRCREQRVTLTARHHLEAAAADAAMRMSQAVSDYTARCAAGTLTPADEARLWTQACEARKITCHDAYARQQRQSLRSNRQPQHVD